jgi:broad specificity phosphatase PhoE
MRRLLLARHGQSVSNAARRFQGQRDVPLSPLGERQAEALGVALRRRVREVAAVYTSPLARARRTAEIAAAGLRRPLVAVEDLRELSLGEWEDLTVDEVRAMSGDPFARWVRDPLACAPPGGEPLLTVQERVVRAIAAIAAAHPDGEDRPRRLSRWCHQRLSRALPRPHPVEYLAARPRERIPHGARAAPRALRE